jgi:serine/threonine protein kinase
MNKRVSINDFILGKNLGEGKFGTVFQAYEKRTKSIYALKKIPKSMIKSHWMIDQFILEVKIQNFCNHPNILSLHGVFEDTEHVYILL